jgi:replicative DNA helicase
MFDELTKHIDIIDDTEIPIENIQSTIITTMEQRSRRYDIVAYDYLDQIRAKGASDTERNSAAAKELRKIGKALHIAQIVLTQVPKEKGGDGNIPIGKDAPMHSGTIVSIAHLLLLFWRPGLGKPEQDNEMACKIGKNRSGKADYVIFFKWIGEQFKLENR